MLEKEHQQYYLLHTDGMRELESKILSIFFCIVYVGREVRKGLKKNFSHIKKSQRLQSFMFACDILITRD